METNFKGTKGKLTLVLRYPKDVNYNNACSHHSIEINGNNFIDIWSSKIHPCKTPQEAEENSNLITDAFEIRQQINFDLPELLEQRNKAVELLQKLTNDATFLEDARQFLKTIE